MLQPADMQQVVDTVKRELEGAVLSPPDWIFSHIKQQLADAIVKALPKNFTESLHEVVGEAVAKAVRANLEKTVSQLMAEGVERGVRPLAEEVALLRRSIQQGRDDDNWWKRGKRPDEEPDPEDGNTLF